MNILNNLSNQIQQFGKTANKIDTSKVKLNSKVNNVPSAETVLDQTDISPKTSKSTIGLLGFEGQNGDLVNRNLLGYSVHPDEALSKVYDDIFGKVDVPTQTDESIIQNKSFTTKGEFLKTYNQRGHALLTLESKQKLQNKLNFLKGSSGVAIQKATSDEFILSPMGNKQQLKQVSGLRNMVDSLNIVITEQIQKLQNSRKQMKAKEVTDTLTQESSIPLFDPRVA